MKIKIVLCVFLLFKLSPAFTVEPKKNTQSLNGTNITYLYSSGRSYNVKFEKKGISYRYLTGSKPEKWWGPFPYQAIEIENNIYFASWHEQGYGDFVTLLINFNNKLLYGSALIAGKKLHFHGAKIQISNK